MERIDIVAIWKATATIEVQMAVVESDHQFVLQAEQVVAEGGAGLIAEQVLFVEHEEAVAADHRRRRVRRGHEAVGLGVDPFPIGVEIVKEVLDFDVVSWPPFDEQLWPILL